MRLGDFVESVWTGVGTGVVVAATTGVDVWATLAGAAIALIIEVLRQRRRTDMGRVRSTVREELDKRCAINHPDQYRVGRTSDGSSK